MTSERSRDDACLELLQAMDDEVIKQQELDAAFRRLQHHLTQSRRDMANDKRLSSTVMFDMRDSGGCEPKQEGPWDEQDEEKTKQSYRKRAGLLLPDSIKLAQQASLDLIEACKQAHAIQDKIKALIDELNAKEQSAKSC